MNIAVKGLYLLKPRGNVSLTRPVELQRIPQTAIIAQRQARYLPVVLVLLVNVSSDAGKVFGGLFLPTDAPVAGTLLNHVEELTIPCYSRKTTFIVLFLRLMAGTEGKGRLRSTIFS